MVCFQAVKTLLRKSAYCTSNRALQRLRIGKREIELNIHKSVNQLIWRGDDLASLHHVGKRFHRPPVVSQANGNTQFRLEKLLHRKVISFVKSDNSDRTTFSL